MRNKQANFRFLYVKQGGHYHVKVFTAPDVNQTFAKNGDLVFDEEEWIEARAKLSRIGQVVDDQWREEAHS